MNYISTNVTVVCCFLTDFRGTFLKIYLIAVQE